jgi:hypothetical protein
LIRDALLDADVAKNSHRDATRKYADTGSTVVIQNDVLHCKSLTCCTKTMKSPGVRKMMWPLKCPDNTVQGAMVAKQGTKNAQHPVPKTGVCLQSSRRLELDRENLLNLNK